MGKYSEVYVAFDTAKLKHAVAIAEGGRQGEIRFLGELANQPATIERLIRKLAARYGHLQVCFEAGPTGYGLYRQQARDRVSFWREVFGKKMVGRAPAVALHDDAFAAAPSAATGRGW